ncbi:DUF5358 family protein [Mannheimia sp. AT1]|uniref:DUF5358 family protein n=1 Tax=Mannheimia cairinae TaxID=3025936 RepID=A0ABT5ML64_9PAST|nr:DUF5358 family protein [Mannheimia cairinae]MDD0822933.1 DUF5358 family protein [Mannheimia cairinae]MDD0826039.1 DUF5358 family protein [Mannheimia cairinae]
MLKKASIILFFGTSCAFASNPENSTALSEPQYKISEIDMKILIRQLNNIEQCIYPDLAKPDYKKIYDSWSVTENLTMQYFERQILKELLGEENSQIMLTDESSMNYFYSLHQKLNHQKANVDKERCEAFKPRYKEIYQRVQNTLPKVYR